MTSQDQIVAASIRYVKAQQVRIDAKQRYIQDLEINGRDVGTIKLEKEDLGAMLKSRDKVLEKLRPFISGQGRWMANR
jgi:hypothetical protein